MNTKKKVTLILLSGFVIICLIFVCLFFYNKQQTQHKPIINQVITTVDTTAPTLTLSAKSNENGDYFINLVRDVDTENFDPMTLVESVSDNISASENIKIECNDVLDTSKSTQYISYIVTDEVNNTSTVKLLIMYSDDPDKIKEQQQTQISEMEEEIARLEAEEQARLEEEERLRQEAEERAEEQSELNVEPAKPQSTEPTSTPKPQVQIYHTVNNFTVASSGNLQADLQNGAMANSSYGGCNGLLYAASFDINGNNVTIHWTCTCGWTGESVATIQ